MQLYTNIFKKYVCIELGIKESMENVISIGL